MLNNLVTSVVMDIVDGVEGQRVEAENPFILPRRDRLYRGPDKRRHVLLTNFVR